MKRILSTGTAALVLAAGLSGCGKDDDKDSGPQPNGVAEMKPAEALRASEKATLDLEDITYTATGRISGQRVTMTMESVVGEACEGTMNFGTKGSIVVRVVGRFQFTSLDRKAAQAQGVPASVAGKWVKEKADRDAKECFTNPTLFTPGKASTFTAGEVKEIDGQSARSFTGKDDEGHPMTLWIATTGEPLVLQGTGKDEDGPYRFVLKTTNSGLEISAPPASQTLSR